jgi:hypothetical protein
MREISFLVKRVLDIYIELLFGNLYSGYLESRDESLRDEFTFTIKTLCKYSSDLKVLSYLGLFPSVIFQKFKKPIAISIAQVLEANEIDVHKFDEEDHRNILQKI